MIKWAGKKLTKYFEKIVSEEGEDISLVNHGEELNVDLDMNMAEQPLKYRARDMLTFSALVYEDQESVDKVLPGMKVQYVGFREDSENSGFSDVHQALLMKHPQHKYWIVSFRGTEPTMVAEYIADATMLLTTSPAPIRGQIHRGFSKCFEDGFFDKCNERLAVDSDPVYICGHSLGGALAVLFAAQFSVRNSDRIAGVYTYGQPRVGTRKFAAFCNRKFGSRTYRFVSKNDIIPRLPPHSAMFPYHHRIGTQIELSVSEDHFVVGGSEPSPLTISTLSTVTGVLTGSLAIVSEIIRDEISPSIGTPKVIKESLPAEIQEHFPSNYARALAKYPDDKYEQ